MLNFNWSLKMTHCQTKIPEDGRNLFYRNNNFLASKQAIVSIFAKLVVVTVFSRYATMHKFSMLQSFCFLLRI